MQNILLGVDIGGTTIKMGITNVDGQMIDKWEIPTQINDKADQIPNDIWNSIKEKLSVHQITEDQLIGIGAGAPGFVIADTGVIAEAVNLGWRNFPLGERLNQLSGLPVYVENDANIAALGENWLGAGDLSDDLIMITLGTGVGGGIITNGKIISGTNGTAGEIGHMTMVHDGHLCNCGRTGCLETIASATGISRLAEEKVNRYQDSSLYSTYQKKNKLSAKDVFKAYEKNDPCAKEVVSYVLDVLGLAISNMTTVLNPEKILIGGGVSKAGDVLLNPLKASYQKYALPRIHQGSTIEIARLGNDAGIIGGAYLVKQHSL